jgi:DNA-binding MarR family transcriptional regulator
MKIETIRNKDLRKYSILPIRAVQDPGINRTAALAVLAVICSYTDELGRTFVSQARIAKDLGISRPAVNRQIKRLFDAGYLVYARKQYKDQKTNTVKVIYDDEAKAEDDARSNLSAREQMELAEREAGLAGVTSEVTPRCNTRVNTPVTSEVTQNETLTSNINDIKGEARRLCVLFLKIAESFGTPRNYQQRDEQVMESWIRQGLDQETWAGILVSHADYCAREKRDFARGIGYFQKPVQRALSGSKDKRVADVLRKTTAAVRRL